MTSSARVHWKGRKRRQRLDKIQTYSCWLSRIELQNRLRTFEIELRFLATGKCKTSVRKTYTRESKAFYLKSSRAFHGFCFLFIYRAQSETPPICNGKNAASIDKAPPCFGDTKTCSAQRMAVSNSARRLSLGSFMAFAGGRPYRERERHAIKKEW